MTVASGRGRRILLVEDNRGDAGLVIELIAQRRQPGDEVVQVATLAAADQALYAAKEGGRCQARFLSWQHAGAPEHAVELRCNAAEGLLRALPAELAAAGAR